MAKYEVDRFESPPDPDLVCCICQCVLYKPLESPCQHVFCKVCIETWLTNRKNCPNCRKSLRVSKLKPVLPIVRNMINRLLIKCDNRKHGCRDKIKLEYYDSHVKECGFMPLKCMNTGCEDTVLRKDMLNHERQCQFRLVVCKKGCGMPIAAEKAHSHNCVAVLKDNIKAMEEAHNRKCKDFERRLKKLEEQVEQILANNESRNADDYEYDWCPGPSPTPAHNDMEGGDGSYWDDDCSPMGTPEYYDTPTSEEMAFQGEEPPQHGHDDDDYTDGRDTPINVEDQESNWSWLNEDERGGDNVEDDDQSEVSDFDGSTEAILSSGEGAEEDDDDGSGHSGSETSHHESRDGEEGVEHTDGSYADHASSEPSSTEHRGHRASSGRGSSSQNERERAASSYSLRSAGSSGVTESDEPITATSTSESTSEVVYVDSTPETSNRRGGNRSRSSAAPTTSQEETPSSSSGTSTTMPISLRLDRLAEMDSASDRTWSPSTRSEEHQESSSRGEQTTTASSTSANSRGTSDNTASRSETSRRRDRSRSNERDRRHRSRDRRRSSTYYSSDEDRSHRSSRRSSTKRSRRR